MRQDETWCIEPDHAHHDPLRVVVAYPHTYFVGMSSLSFLTVVRLFQETGVCQVDRAFFYPGKSHPPQGHTNGKTFDLDRNIKAADLLALSVSFENDYFHVCQLLDASGLQVRAAERRGGPYVLIGGVSPSTNPLPLVEVADAIYLGEAEAVLEEAAAVIHEHQALLRSPGWAEGREATNEALAQLPGFLVPAIHWKGGNEFERVEYASTAFFETSPSYSSILSPHTAYASMNLIEVGRGCPRYCKFCLAGFIHINTRWKTPGAIQESVERCLPHARRVGLIAAIPSQHPQIKPVLQSLLDQGLEFSLSSQSFSSLSDEVMALLVQGGMETLTIGLETFDEELQKRLGKPVPYPKLVHKLEVASDLGIKRFRAYIMIGLPGETEASDQEIIDKTIALRDLLKARVKGRFELSLSINPFIPKPLTPWEAAPMLHEPVFEQRIRRIMKALQKEPDIQMKYESPRESWIQGVLSIGDTAVGHWLTEHYNDPSPYQAMHRAAREGELELATLIQEPRPHRMEALLAFIDRGADPIGDKLRLQGLEQVLGAR
ncbi:MAG TPA: radical SAM protein [bacterium]|nr:radical SAM protein [bacterium]